MSKKTRSSTKVILEVVRWVLILLFTAALIYGWSLSFSKYRSGKTSISLRREELGSARYPSVTFCTNFTGELGYSSRAVDFAKILVSKNVTRVDPKELDSYLESVTRSLTDFIQIFGHSEGGDPSKSAHLLTDPAAWTVTYPDVRFAGRCLTYDPAFNSSTGTWYGIRFGFRRGVGTHDNDTGSEVIGDRDIKLYVHPKGSFIYGEQDGQVNTHNVDLSALRRDKYNSVVLSYGRYEVLDTEDSPCVDDEDYDFHRCTELRMSEWRGCQPPWHMFGDSPLPACDNASAFPDLFPESQFQTRGFYLPRDLGLHADKAFFSSHKLGAYLECLLPCSRHQYRSVVSSSPVQYLDWGYNESAAFVTDLWFKDFVFTYETEYLVCDFTCFLGEVGGTLGFYLGGSLLGTFDVLKDLAISRSGRR